MNRRDSATLITLGSSGGISYQHFGDDDLVAEGYLDTGMFAAERHPLLTLHDGDGDLGWPRRGAVKRGSRKRK
ncbi:MAG: hypothetical protein ACAI38_04025 [Myxococcota bacterium]